MYQYHTLNNGIRIVFRQNNSKVTHSGIYINVGSRDERGRNEGIAHFIEHTVFKGTEHRRSYHILNRIDGVGGELNAFTTKEETCLYASSLSIHLERCLELFSDIIFHSTFPEKEIENEKDVVLEEIKSYKDSPADLIYDDFEQLVFDGHPLAHNILGTPHNVKHFTSQGLLDFLQSNYTTDRMVISVVGCADFRRVVRMCEKYFGDYERRNSAVDRKQAPQYRHFNSTMNRRTHQMHIMVGGRAPDTFDERKVAFSLLNNIMGGPAMNSRLNVAIREKHGFCYTIESQYTPFSDAGLFYIYAGIEADAREHYLELLHRELRRLVETPLSDSQIRNAKQQFVGQMAINNESALNEMQAIGKSYLTYDRVDTLEEMQRDIEAVTAAELRDIAAELFNPENLSCLIYK
ncbi:MAG: insulinase family protein [Bacteroidales bacterium]|nr:insulinase family protein [Bacteroidales bacterium]